jgi:protein-S-isoprenylcysteine O-methyltransferase Ste14
MLRSLEQQGAFLFRWRSYLPLMCLPVLAWEVSRFSYPLGSHFYDRLVELTCFAIAGIGLSIRALVQGYARSGTSARNTRQRRATRLNTTGMYSVCRHPLYLGNYLISFGVLLFFRSPYLLAVFTLLFWLYYERIILVEEAFLAERFGDAYRAWVAATPVFLPRLSGWRQPGVPFRLSTVLRREYTTVLLIVVAMTSFEVLGDFALHHRFEIGPLWLALLFFAALQYVVLRALKKHTHWLQARPS